MNDCLLMLDLVQIKLMQIVHSAPPPPPVLLPTSSISKLEGVPLQSIAYNPIYMQVHKGRERTQKVH